MDLNFNSLYHAVVRKGVFSISTPSCGCCSEYYSTDTETCFKAWTLPVDDLLKYIDKEQARLDALSEYAAQNVAGDFIDFVPED
jgi:hypothetical protein